MDGRFGLARDLTSSMHKADRLGSWPGVSPDRKMYCGGVGRAQEWGMWKVGNLEPTDIPGAAEAGWEFNITTEHGRPLLTLVYKTKAEGSAAAAHVLSAIRKAALVRSHG